METVIFTPNNYSLKRLACVLIQETRSNARSEMNGMIGHD